MNVERVDLGDFIFFVNVFTGNSGTEYTHHHDDLLSYSVFLKDRELLIDLGRPSYAHTSPWVNAQSHNGMWSEQQFLRPVSRFFFPRAFSINAIDLTFQRNDDGFKASAFNRLTNSSRWLHACIQQDRVEVSEGQTCNNARSAHHFSHFFPSAEIKLLSSSQLQIHGVIFSYDCKVRLKSASRSAAYGKIGPASKIYFDVGIGHSCKCDWGIQIDR